VPHLIAVSPEAYNVTYISSGFGGASVYFSPLYPWEAAFPGLVGCSSLTVRSSVRAVTDVIMGGAVRRLAQEEADESHTYLVYQEPDQSYSNYRHAQTGTFSIPSTERSFTAPRGCFFSVSDLAAAVTSLPESWRQIARHYGLVWKLKQFDDPELSCGRFEKLELPPFRGVEEDYELPQFVSCTLSTDLKDAKFHPGEGGHGVLEVEWMLCDEGQHHDTDNHFHMPFLESPSKILDSWDWEEDDNYRDRGQSITALMQLRKDCVDRARWAPEHKRRRNPANVYSDSEPLPPFMPGSTPDQSQASSDSDSDSDSDSNSD